MGERERARERERQGEREKENEIVQESKLRKREEGSSFPCEPVFPQRHTKWLTQFTINVKNGWETTSTPHTIHTHAQVRRTTKTKPLIYIRHSEYMPFPYINAHGMRQTRTYRGLMTTTWTGACRQPSSPHHRFFPMDARIVLYILRSMCWPLPPLPPLLLLLRRKRCTW